MRWLLMGFAGSWLAWFILFGISWDRYMYPATFVGSIFAAVLLRDITDNFNWRAMLTQAWDFARLKILYSVNRRAFWRGALSLVTVLWIGFTVLLNLTIIFFTLFSPPSEYASAVKVTDYLNQTTEPDALIETYEEWVIFLFKDHRYHYPPDQDFSESGALRQNLIEFALILIRWQLTPITWC
jgi:hypothetical protein